MASPGPAPPCVQADHHRLSRRQPGPQSRPGAHEASERAGERVSPRTPPWRPRFGMGPPRPRSLRSVRDRPRRPPPPRRARRPPFTFIAPLGLVRPMTRTHVRLLGPCYKTGRVGHRPFARRERGPRGPLCCTTVAGQPGHRRFPPSPKAAALTAATAQGYQSNRAFDVPSNGSRRPTSRGEIRPPTPARVRARPRVPGSPQRIPHPADLSRRAESPRFDLRGPTRLTLNGFTYS